MPNPRILKLLMCSLIVTLLVTVLGTAAAQYQEAPMLADMVAAGGCIPT